MKRKPYPTDLTDKEWAEIEPIFNINRSCHGKGGRPRDVDIREVVNALFYVLQTGCSWRMLPHDYPKWETVYWYFQQWMRDGTLERANEVLRKKVRVMKGKDEEPSLCIGDSQSIRMSYQMGKKRI